MRNDEPTLDEPAESLERIEQQFAADLARAAAETIVKAHLMRLLRRLPPRRSHEAANRERLREES
jgi:hypothetical protein